MATLGGHNLILAAQPGQDIVQDEEHPLIVVNDQYALTQHSFLLPTVLRTPSATQLSPHVMPDNRFPATTQRIIQTYKMFGPADRVLVAVSGGKDSLSLWDVLDQLGYQTEGLYISLGIDGSVRYSAQSREKIEKFLETRPHLKLHVVDVKETYGRSIPELARVRRRGRPCSVCGLTRRHIMNRVAYEGDCSVLATGHNLDDEVAVLFQNTLRWQTGYLARQSPVLPSIHPRLARKVKPFCRFYERETAAYALLRGIDYIYDECPHAVGNTVNFYKEVLNKLEAESPGTKMSFYISFLKAKDDASARFSAAQGTSKREPRADASEEGLFGPGQKELGLYECEHCGQPTSVPGLCAFCRQWETLTPATESAQESVET